MTLSAQGMEIWQKEIKQAEDLLEQAHKDPTADIPNYRIELDPEDFLDLINGKWDSK